MKKARIYAGLLADPDGGKPQPYSVFFVIGRIDYEFDVKSSVSS